MDTLLTVLTARELSFGRTEFLSGSNSLVWVSEQFMGKHTAPCYLKFLHLIPALADILWIKYSFIYRSNQEILFIWTINYGIGRHGMG